MSRANRTARGRRGPEGVQWWQRYVQRRRGVHWLLHLRESERSVLDAPDWSRGEGCKHLSRPTRRPKSETLCVGQRGGG